MDEKEKPPSLSAVWNLVDQSPVRDIKYSGTSKRYLESKISQRNKSANEQFANEYLSSATGLSRNFSKSSESANETKNIHVGKSSCNKGYSKQNNDRCQISQKSYNTIPAKSSKCSKSENIPAVGKMPRRDYSSKRYGSKNVTQPDRSDVQQRSGSKNITQPDHSEVQQRFGSKNITRLDRSEAHLRYSSRNITQPDHSEVQQRSYSFNNDQPNNSRKSFVRTESKNSDPHKTRSKSHASDTKDRHKTNSETERCEPKLPYIKHNKSVRPISYSGLMELVTKEPEEILMTICLRDCAFMKFMAEKNIKVDMMALALIVLGKACSASYKQTLYTFLNTIRSNTDFLISSIQLFLVALRQKSMKDYHFESLSYLTIFLQKFQQSLPSASSDLISILLPLLRMKCESFLKDHDSFSDVLNNLNEIEKHNEYTINKFSHSDAKGVKSNKNVEEFEEPPDNFRSLPILPNIDDIHSVPYLRPNVVEGKYVDTEHYLDVQYRLLREDYVRPLRDGIGEYLRLKEAGKPVNRCRDARVYEDVHVVKQEFVNGTLLHIVQLTGSFSKIKWEHSKRFISGSLLCLSSDNFQSMLFASVARKMPEQLKKGLLLIRFEEVTDEVLSISPLQSFVIIETSAYFEAYRYNLKALHESDESTLPLKRYIVDVKTSVHHPQYLKHHTMYDMRPLLVPLNDTNIKRRVAIDGDVNFEYDFPPKISTFRKLVPILSNSSWPSASDLNLDDSQYLALKAAVTKEFSVIQGPPGTGKTYIGLRVVQLLLHNIDKWFTKETNSLPILVVCYTNHALDQFLEGMMCFTDKLVRIGGRGTNEAVSKFQLSNLKKTAVNKREIPHYIRHGLYIQNQELKNSKLDIDRVSYLIQRSMKNILGEKELQQYMPDFQYESLKAFVYASEFKEFKLADDGPIIQDWLGVRSSVQSVNFEVPLDKRNKDKPVVADKSAVADPKLVPVEDDQDSDLDEESSGAADIEFIEAQRDIDTEDFAEVSFNIDEPEKEELSTAEEFGWQYQGGRKQRSKFIRNWLHKSKPLPESEALKIKNVWNINLETRWNLYKFWLHKMIDKKQEESMNLQTELKRQYQRYCDLRTEADIHILRMAHVLGMTTTGAAKYRGIVQRLNPQILIVEEAAEILESHIVTSLAPNTQHVILIGDHQQLQPSPTVYMLAVKYKLNISLFERLIKNKMDCYRLSMQHRMRPDIADLIVPHIYKDLKNHESVSGYENIRGVCRNVFFINHDFNELQENDSKSRSNQHEANFLIKLCRYFVQQGYESSQITVLTTYSGQLFLMKRMVRANAIIQNVRFTVVDNYQGEENDIILISFVRSNEDGEIGFLKVANRVCVALSRAKKGLYCIGNFELLAEKSDLWKNITKTLRKKKAIGPSLQLLCQNHPEVCNVVADANDFESVPEGGCTKVCDYRLSCGHVCSLMCHPYDRLHEDVQCHKECKKTCKEGHKCHKKCYQNCGPCEVLVNKKMYTCGHTIKVPCDILHSEVKCNAKCDKVMICGHTCSNKCFEPCSEFCREIITIKSAICNHEVTVQCRYKSSPEELRMSCKTPCNAILDCGHQCKGNCYDCHQGRLHIACNQSCKRILVCGHECRAPCAKSCPPCKLPCENRCIHSRCPKLCGEPCDLCTEKCKWQCEHKACPNLCGEICDRTPCSKPCIQLLDCGHQCIGFCGEPCPVECRICNSEVVKEIFFGTEDEEDSRFVCLEDCNHILEINGLKEWMSVKNENNQIQMKACPKCKTVIRTNLRFGNIVKSCLKQIENVKEKTYGSEVNNDLLKKRLLTIVENSPSLAQLQSDSTIFYDFWKKILSAKRPRSILEITTMENIVRLSLELAEVQFTVPTYQNQDPDVSQGLSNLCKFVKASGQWLLKFMRDESFTASEQQLQQLSTEVHRLKLSYKLFSFAERKIVEVAYPAFEKCISVLVKNFALSEEDIKIFCTSFTNLSNSCGSAVINISDIEKQSILKAMKLTAGHWYQCPNGHVYCITECGGAMEKSRCNECNAEIGGANHSLLSTNRVSTDMDGARHSAWSDAMNLGNYEF